MVPRSNLLVLKGTSTQLTPSVEAAEGITGTVNAPSDVNVISIDSKEMPAKSVLVKLPSSRK